MKSTKRVVLGILILTTLLSLFFGFRMVRLIGVLPPPIVSLWQKKISELNPGTVIIVTDRESDLELGRKYDIPIVMGYDELWFSNGGIVSYSYPNSYYEDPNWTPPGITSTFWYFNRNGWLLGAYRVDYTAEAQPDSIEVYFSSADLPKNCEYSKGTYTNLIDEGRSYFLEIYDDGGGWSRGCDSN